MCVQVWKIRWLIQLEMQQRTFFLSGQVFCICCSACWQHGSIGLLGHSGCCHCGEEPSSVLLTVGCQRTEGPESMMEELERPFLSTNTLLSSNFRAVLQLTGCSVLLTCSLKDNILYFSWTGSPSLCLGLWMCAFFCLFFFCGKGKDFYAQHLFFFLLLSKHESSNTNVGIESQSES